MQATIYQPSKTAMQSGRAKTDSWTLEFEPATPSRIDPLMGWTSSDDTRQQLKLNFESLEAACGYCDKHEIAYRIQAPQARRVRPTATVLVSCPCPRISEEGRGRAACASHESAWLSVPVRA